MELKAENRNAQNGSLVEKTVFEMEDETNIDCGICGWRPKWLKKLANPKVFTLNFSLIGVLRTAYFTYFISIMSTLERRYAFPSKLTAFILIADNISGMIVSPIIGYFGSKFKGPPVIGAGMMLVSISCFLNAVPYFIYGPGYHLLSEDFSKSMLLNKSLHNGHNYEMCALNDEDCNHDEGHPFEVGAYAFLWIASFVNGLGYTTFWTIGLPFIDNNVKKKNSAIYLSVTTVIRMTGVTFGYFLSGFTLSFYENPLHLPRKDPRYVGAWWIGFILIGAAIFLCSLPMFIFPDNLKKKANKSLLKKDKHMSFRDAFGTFKRVVTNPILVFDTIGGGIRYIGLAGYWITKPRYIEAQFSKSASTASILTGATSTAMKAIGILIGGIFVSKMKPKPKLLVALIVIIELSCNVLIFSAMFFGCPQPNFNHITSNDDTVNLLTDYNKNCGCSTRVFQPVCDATNKTNFFSPCFAGCKQVNASKKVHTFSECSFGNEDSKFTAGYCENDCNSITGYLTVITLAGTISSLARTANLLIALRCVEPRDKNFAMGLISSYMALFVFIPYPIIFGFVIDATCLVWEKTCGETGNCWLYDLPKMKNYLHGTTFVFAMIGSLFDILVYLNAHRLNNMYDDDDDEKIADKSQSKSESLLQNNNAKA